MALTNEEILNAVAEKTVLELVELISAFEENILHTIDALFAFIVGVFDQLN